MYKSLPIVILAVVFATKDICLKMIKQNHFTTLICLTSGALVRKDPQEPADRPDGREGARHVQHHLPQAPGQGRPLDQWGGGEGANLFMRLNFLKLFLSGY